MRRLRGEVLRFLFAGGLCAAIQYGLLALSVEWLHWQPVPAAAIAFAVAAALNYLLNHRFTWASGAPHGRAALRFLAVLCVGLAITTLFMQGLHGYLGWHYLLAQVSATAATLVWNFFAHRHWTFRHDAPA
jgi:putative flippase GtrA